MSVLTIPGSKATVADLTYLRETGLADAVTSLVHAGTPVIGLCGGYQMLGRRILDPLGVESAESITRGLGVLPIDTVMAAEKTTEVRSATTRGGVSFAAYEIHMGMTTIDEGVEPFARLDDGRADGACVGRVIGTYLHGALENAAVCSE